MHLFLESYSIFSTYPSIKVALASVRFTESFGAKSSSQSYLIKAVRVS